MNFFKSSSYFAYFSIFLLQSSSFFFLFSSSFGCCTVTLLRQQVYLMFIFHCSFSVIVSHAFRPVLVVLQKWVSVMRDHFLCILMVFFCLNLWAQQCLKSELRTVRNRFRTIVNFVKPFMTIFFAHKVLARKLLKRNCAEILFSYFVLISDMI